MKRVNLTNLTTYEVALVLGVEEEEEEQAQHSQSGTTSTASSSLSPPSSSLSPPGHITLLDRSAFHAALTRTPAQAAALQLLRRYLQVKTAATAAAAVTTSSLSSISSSSSSSLSYSCNGGNNDLAIGRSSSSFDDETTNDVVRVGSKNFTSKKFLSHHISLDDDEEDNDKKDEIEVEEDTGNTGTVRLTDSDKEKGSKSTPVGGERLRQQEAFAGDIRVPPSFTHQELRELFDALDRDRDGVVTVFDLR